MKNKKIKLSIQLHNNPYCYVSFEGNFVDQGKNLEIEVPKVFENLFETLQSGKEPLGYLERLESSEEINLEET